ncbi:hypothetical protein ACFOKI_05625 [Sphingomonas qilianensis]|uniref:Uncharacterized protein n=1 Tax=Sphingomonas qilianensis TaxID=1736690 RepID=A0ABU9XRN5_9SPHN
MMFNTYEDYGELLEAVEAVEDVEDTEDYEDYESARRGRGARPIANRFGKVATAPKGNPVPKKVADGYATKADLHVTAQRLDARIATNSKAVTTLDTRTRSIENETNKLRVEFRRELAERKAVTEALKRSLDEQRQLAVMLPLLSTQETTDALGVPNVVVDNGDQMSKLLPILLLSGGLGGNNAAAATPGASPGMFGGNDNGMATLAIMMALTSGKK